MTTFIKLLSNPPADLHNYGLLFADDVYNQLMAMQDTRPDYQHKVAPLATTNDRWLLNADVLTEIHTGIFATGFALLDTSIFANVFVLPWSECLLLIPTSTEME